MNKMYIVGDIVTYKGSNPTVHNELSALGRLTSNIGLTAEYQIAPENQEYVLSDNFQQLMLGLGVTIKPWCDVLDKLDAFNQNSCIEMSIADLHLGGGTASMLMSFF